MEQKKKQKTDTLNISKIYIEASPEARDPEDRREDTESINAAFDNIPINIRKLYNTIERGETCRKS